MDKILLKNNLIELQYLDLKIDSLVEERESGEEVVALKDAEILFKDTKKELKSINEELKDYRNESKELENKINKFNLDLVSNSKRMRETNIPYELTNYETKEKEIRNNIDSTSAEVVKLNNKFESQLNDKNRLETKIENLKKDLVQISQKVVFLWENLDKKIAILEPEKEILIRNIPDEYFVRYEKLRMSEKVVVGYVNEGQCGICGVLLSSSEIAEIESKKSDECSSCNGILL